MCIFWKHNTGWMDKYYTTYLDQESVHAHSACAHHVMYVRVHDVYVREDFMSVLEKLQYNTMFQNKEKKRKIAKRTQRTWKPGYFRVSQKFRPCYVAYTSGICEIDSPFNEGGCGYMVKDVRVHSDSKYALGVLSGEMRAYANRDLVAMFSRHVSHLKSI